MQNLVPICRVCLKTSLEYIDFETPFESPTFDENVEQDQQQLFTYLDCFRFCTHIDVKNCLSMQSLCDACGLELRITYDFLKKAEWAEKVLQETKLNEEEDLEKFDFTEVYEDIQENHELNEQDDQTYQCICCNETFHSQYVFNLHKSGCHNDNTNPDIFEALSEEHIEDENNEATHSTEEHIKLEMLDDSAEEVELSYDSKDTKSNDNSINGQDEKYDDISEEPDHEHKAHADQKDLLCSICSKTFTSLSILSAHLKYHQRKQANVKSDACKICGKKFSTNHYLRIHMNVHQNVTERELHPCMQCDKMYVSKTALDNHLRMHKGETIECKECKKKFPRQYDLNVHMRFHTRTYPFECDVCGKKFAIKGHLRTHKWHHEGLKLQCDDCGKLFSSTKALLEHSFTHTEMPFPCRYCSKGYPSKQKYKVHLKAVHQIELNDLELQKITKNNIPKPLLRKKLTLVQADSFIKEVEVKSKEDSGSNDATK